MKKFLLLLSVLFVVSCSIDVEKYVLTTSANPEIGGTVSPTTKQYSDGDTAKLIALPAAEYELKDWSGDASGTLDTISVVMNSDKTVVANFVKKKYALTVNIEGEGTVTEKVIKAGAATDYNSGTIVELTAVSKEGWEFKQWTGDLISSSIIKEITIDKPKTVTAVFETLPPFYLDENGVTIKARDGVTAGTTGKLGGVTYTAVDNTTLKEMATQDQDVSKVVTTLVTDLEKLFHNKTTFNTDISSWDVSNVTNMNNLFSSYVSVFNQDISSWDVSKVTDMRYMFHNATAFNKNYQVHLEKQEKELIRKEKLSGSNHGGKLKFMHIVKLKLWAKRAVARAQGHHHGVDPPGKQVLNYAEALHSLANRHNYSDLVQFKSIHQDLLEHCVTIMARHMKPET